MVLLCVFLLSSLLVKKAFCSWLCPVGRSQNIYGKLGRKVFKRTLVVPKWLDVPLRGLKYVLLAFFAYIVFTMPALDLGSFLASPFGIVADVKMLDFFRYLGHRGPGCNSDAGGAVGDRAELLVPVSLPVRSADGTCFGVSPVKIRRDAAACIDCGKCNKACPSQLPVDRLVQIRSVRCTGCMECVGVRPAENALQMALMPRKAETTVARWRRWALKPQMVAAVVAVVFFGLIGAARMTGHWQTDISREIYMQLVPNAENFDH